MFKLDRHHVPTEVRVSHPSALHGFLAHKKPLGSRFALKALDGNVTLKIVDTDIEGKDYLRKAPKGEKVEKKKVWSRAI